jgi:hypothetical protein
MVCVFERNVAHTSYWALFVNALEIALHCTMCQLVPHPHTSATSTSSFLRTLKDLLITDRGCEPDPTDDLVEKTQICYPTTMGSYDVMLIKIC